MSAPARPADLDAIVVGAGPNGLAAAITLARAGRSVTILEAAPAAGGGSRSAELTLPGFIHDPCSAIHAVALASPFLRTLDLAARGVEWVHSDAPVAHPLGGDRSAILERSVHATADALGSDGRAWRRLFGALVGDAERLMPELLGPVAHVPRHPLALARFGVPALRSTRGLARSSFAGEGARALFAGISAHSMLPLTAPLSASFGLVLAIVAHAHGWPLARGGSQAVADALIAEATDLGVEIVTGHPVRSMSDLPPARAVLFALTPKQVVSIAGDRLATGPRRRLDGFRYGPGVFKLDWALDGPIPWTAPDVGRAATVHLGGTLDEIAASEAEVNAGRHPERPYVLLVQPTLFDSTRAPTGKHTAWAYCHVPNGSTIDMTSRIEGQVERFAPGFRDLILARRAWSPSDMERYDENYVGGDINGGIQDWRQLIFRPSPTLDPYHLGRGLYLCSSSTPPGGGVHGMSGWHAARSALRRDLA